MPDLRSNLIRLAHANPELRPHLLPILKKGRSKIWIPKTPETWGFKTEGPAADKAAKELGASLERGVSDLETAVEVFKRDMKAALQKARPHYDSMDPLASISLVSAGRLKELSEEVDRYFYY